MASDKLYKLVYPFSDSGLLTLEEARELYVNNILAISITVYKNDKLISVLEVCRDLVLDSVIILQAIRARLQISKLKKEIKSLA